MWIVQRPHRVILIPIKTTFSGHPKYLKLEVKDQGWTIFTQMYGPQIFVFQKKKIEDMQIMINGSAHEFVTV